MQASRDVSLSTARIPTKTSRPPTKKKKARRKKKRVWARRFAGVVGRRRRATALPGLVVVASLVEKIPNLAGLARTCEVLGAERLVLADLGVAKHKDFTSVSVTAEKWLRLDECPIFGIAAYLKRLKREGYFLVGLEQTRGAEDVEAHAWHRKTALVLGREREGIDADILGMLDACVVIRQRGMIRSLNATSRRRGAVAEIQRPRRRAKDGDHLNFFFREIM